jgi:hypothetical protein
LSDVLQGKRPIRHDGKGTLPIAIVESDTIPALAFSAEKAHDMDAIDARRRLSGEVAPIGHSDRMVYRHTWRMCVNRPNRLKVYRK